MFELQKPLMTAYFIPKRALDLAVAAVAAPIALPACLFLMALIRLESPGSPLFVQWRVGRHKRPFRMMKLRTMTRNTAHVPSHEVELARITRLGRILRKLKLDELPQLWNVLTGSMSLVGPRPCLPSQDELIEAREALGLFEVPPGLTGPAQLVNVDMSEPLRLAQVESQYFAHSTLRSDLMIIFRTLAGGGAGDPAVERR